MKGHSVEMTPVSLQARREQLLLLNEPLFTGSMDELLVEISALVRSGGKHLIVTPNVDQVLNLETDVGFRSAFKSAAIRPIDGAPLAWLGTRLLGRRVLRNTGADLMTAICADQRFSGVTVALVGGEAASARAAADALARTGPVCVSSVDTPYAEPDSGDYLEVVDELQRIRPDVVFVGMGSPRQEAWTQHWFDSLPDAVYIGSGAAYAFASGKLRRAPRWIRGIGAEWIFRLAQEPARLAHRYLIKGPRFIVIMARSLRATERQR